MIKKIELTRFKKYKSQSFSISPKGLTLLVGGNNAGKSTLIHALSVWEFCKMILLHEKGRKVFNQTEIGNGDGFGMSAEEFLPIAVPSLNHLWTNLKTQLSPAEKEEWPDEYPGYIMRIKCIWDYNNEVDKMLEIGLSLVNDRLFIRVTNSNLENDDHLLSIVYLPTFAGVLPKENKATIAERRAYLGRGMAGSVIRNMIYDLHIEEQRIKEELLNGKVRLNASEKESLLERSPLQKLQRNLRNTFGSEIEIEPFSEEFHTVLKINERKVIKGENGELSVLPKSKYTPRDIITQGSGYLQWLSIFCILYSSEIDVILLDEPDAHLHASLQSELLNRLLEYGNEEYNRQILISTHSVEMIKQAPLNIVFSMDKRKYLTEESARVATLAGIGSEYFPKLDLLKRYKRLVFVENESDEKILKILAEKCSVEFPQDVVFWANTETHAIRRHIFTELQKIIPELRCLSLRDRDMDNPDVVGEGLKFKAIDIPKDSPIILLQWRRKNIESYLLCPRAIAAAASVDVSEVKKHIGDNFALSIDDEGYIEAKPPEAIVTCDGKHVFTKEDVGLERVFGCNKYDVAKKMTENEICEDIKVFFAQMNALFC